MSEFETAIANLANNFSLDEEKKKALLTLARSKRTSANKRWFMWVLLFLMVVIASAFSLHLFGYTEASFKAVGAGLGVIGALMAFLKEKETISSKEAANAIGKHLSKVDLDQLNENLGDAISSSSWIKLVSSIATFIGVILITWKG